MALASLIPVFALAIITNGSKSNDVEFIKDFVIQKIDDATIFVGYSCWSKDDKFALISKLSSKNIIASIYDMDEKNILRYYPPEKILYMVDLDCNNSTNILFTASQFSLFNAPYKWLLVTKNKDYITNIHDFAVYNFSVDSNIILAHKSDINQFNLFEIYKYSTLGEYVRNNYVTFWSAEQGFNETKSSVSPDSRRNLNGTFITATIVVLNNNTFNHLSDYRFKHIDTITKVNYILTNHLYDFMNAVKELKYVPTWGYLNKEDNLYTGMIGTLQRNQAEIGGTPLFLTLDRVSIIEYIAMTTPTRAKFIFRPPPLSYVTNVFTLPFSRDVWLSSFGLCVLASVLLYITVSFEWRSSPSGVEVPPTFSDSVMLTIGAVAQQGAANEPQSGAGRTMMLMTFMALMFLYTSYSANIVALLQSSATNIRTLEDLLNSRLKLGVDDNVYNHYYFESATEPIRKAIYEKKVAPKGQKPGWMKIDEGVAKIRDGFFAFHGEQGQIYKLVADTFYESEKCGIQEIQYLQVVEPYFAIKKNSSYKEILKVGLRKIQESGIQSRELQRLYTKKPDCHTTGGNFVSVGLIDAYPAFLVLGAGMALSLILFFVEKITNKKLQRREFNKPAQPVNVF